MARRLGVALLAAGSSKRFGKADKLAARFRGRMVAQYAALAIPVERFEKAWVISAAPDHPCEPTWRDCGFSLLLNHDAAQGMGTSVALAARAAMEASLDGLLIALGDMPLVPRSHFEAMIKGCIGPDCLVVSALCEVRMPPAIFGSAHFARLSEATGDKGARALLGQGEIVDCPAAWLKDIDTIDDLDS